MLKPHQEPLLRFLARHVLGGIVVGWVLLGLLLWSDAGGLGTLVMNGGAIPLVMLIVMFAITFGSAQAGIGVMLGLKERDGEPPARRQRIEPAAPAIPVPASARARGRQA
ncbi:hypothetical protein [Parapedomonas caeni]|jgi:hypothetical protein